MRRREPAADYADVCANHIAAQLDALYMLAGAAGSYRRQLVAAGFEPSVAMMLAAQWTATMQATLGEVTV